MPVSFDFQSAIEHYRESVPISSILPINSGLRSAREHTMVSVLGSPEMPLTTKGQNARASDLVKALRGRATLAPHVTVEGINPALESLTLTLDAVFRQEPELRSVLGTEGMLSVRLRKPTDGSVSKQISNHAWGTAVDFKLANADAPGNTGASVPRFIALMVPVFNQAGWFSGIAFRDAMHFEVADQTIEAWSKDGKLKPV